MAVRNFYVEAHIDGRQTKLGGGPASKTGGMTVRIYQRDEGAIVDAFLIESEERDGELITKIFDENHTLLLTKTTKR